MRTSTIVLASLGFLSSFSSRVGAASSSNSSGLNTTSVIATTEKNLQTLSCYIYSDLSFYDLSALQNNQSDYSVTNANSLYYYNFNFCRYATNPCGNGGYSYAYREKKVAPLWGSRCLALTDDDYTPDSVTAYDGTATNTTSHLLYTLGGGDECNDQDASIIFNVVCDVNATGTPSFQVNDTDVCHPIVSFTHAAGCPTANLNSFASYVSENPWVIALFCIIVGPITNFWGKKFIPWVIGIVSGSAAFVVSMITFSFMGLLDYFTNSTNEGLTPALISIAVAIIIGAFTGYFMMTKFLTLGFCVLGGVAGFFLGGIIFNLFMVQWVTSVVALWCTVIFMAMIGVCLAYYFRDNIVIMSTSFIGSYLFIRGISIIFGGYPSEMELYNEISTGTAEFSTTFIGYLIAMAVFFLGGFVYQTRQKMHDDEYKLADD